MVITNDCLWLCSDCTQVACNGTHGIKLYNAEATIAGLAKLPHLVPSFDSETGDGIREFSSRICESCGTSLAGYRAKFAQLESEV
jgi:hypothetical protein